MKKHIFYLIFILILFGCTTYPINTSSGIPSQQLPTMIMEIGDGGLISQYPCGPPCFLGIVPGVSKEINVRNQIKRISTPTRCDAFDYSQRVGGGMKGISCNFGDFIFDNDGLIEGIDFFPKLISIKQLIGKYNPPNLVTVGLISIPDSPPVVKMILWYDEYNMRILLPDQPGNYFIVTENLCIESVGYYQQTKYNFYKSIGQGINWNGYTSYEINSFP